MNPSTSSALDAGTAVRIFACFAFAYFFSALVRGVTATLAPSFSAELGLQAADLGLLAGAYFVGFALTQLPLGGALDRHGPRRVLLVLLAVAVLGCMAFASAPGLTTLGLARALIGVGVSACLMAPMTTFRHRFSPTAQIRANSWMLMSGSLGMVASTLPVQWLLPLWGWRGLFWALAGMFLLSALAIWRWVPADAPTPMPAAPRSVSTWQRLGLGGYREVVRNPVFLRFVPMGFCHYGGMIAIQSLWAGPWRSSAPPSGNWVRAKPTKYAPASRPTAHWYDATTLSPDAWPTSMTRPMPHWITNTPRKIARL